MLVIGLTGGIGSGKSTVSHLFAQLGVPIIDADLIARQITESNDQALSSIIEHFGKKIVSENGALNRAVLRDIIFNHPPERLWLEDLLHPLIREEMQQQIRQLSEPYCIAVIPLLLEVEFHSFINRILVVDAPENLQIERTRHRDQIQSSQIEAILKTQAHRHDRIARAHDVIVNDGTLEDLIPQVEKLHQQYLKLSKSYSS